MKNYYLGKADNTYANAVKALRIFFREYLHRDIAQSFKMPKKHFEPKEVPTKEELKTFYGHLPSMKYRTLFLFLSSSGLRLSEALSLKLADLDLNNDAIIPRKNHVSRTKRTWVSFYNRETKEKLKEYLKDQTSDRLFP